MFEFLKRRVDSSIKQTFELQNENVVLWSAIEELAGLKSTTKQTPPIEPSRVKPIIPRNLFSTNNLSTDPTQRKQQGKRLVKYTNDAPFFNYYTPQIYESLDIMEFPRVYIEFTEIKRERGFEY